MKILTVFGTRPEAIKMAPVVKALMASAALHPVLCLTGQHRDMLAGILDFFGLAADHDLAIMQPEQDLVYVTAAALAAFYAGCRIGHVEAGLRTGDLRRPWPEEMNRSVIDRLADCLFAPTEGARANLLRENIPAEKIVVTGNTVVDALLAVRAALERDAALQRSAAAGFGFLDPSKKLILVTGHRRESFGRGFEEICAGLRRIAERDDVQIVYPVHLNPSVQGPVRRILGALPNVHLLEPLDYVPFVYLMMRSPIILTDSGGIQEEAPSIGKPLLVMREVTERPEAVAAGTVALVGT